MKSTSSALYYVALALIGFATVALVLLFWEFYRGNPFDSSWIILSITVACFALTASEKKLYEEQLKSLNVVPARRKFGPLTIVSFALGLGLGIAVCIRIFARY